jgi:hypothetical protein
MQSGYELYMILTVVISPLNAARCKGYLPSELEICAKSGWKFSINPMEIKYIQYYGVN